jgi:hypothetical protein
VRVDRAQQSLRLPDHMSDICIAVFFTLLTIDGNDRCGALLEAVCGPLHARRGPHVGF